MYKRIARILLYGVVAAALYLAWIHGLSGKNEMNFAAVFGIDPGQKYEAKVAVDHHMRLLLTSACKSSKDLHVIYADIYPLQVVNSTTMSRIRQAEKLAIACGFTVPDELERFRNRPKWPRDAKFDELTCW